MQFERPRVRAEGPGGPDVKQGAKIACLDCRSAKIRCSAPTDGRVPCKRCARHGRECVFEKHRRGRKPGRTNNSKHDYDLHNDQHHHSGSSIHSSPHSSSGEYGHYGNIPSYGMSASGNPSHSIGQREKDVSQSHRYAQPGYFTQSQDSNMHDSYGQNLGDLRLSSSTSNNNPNAWRQSIHSDDPRIVSPRTGTLRPMQMPSTQSMHDINRSTHSPSFPRPSLSPPHIRESRSAHASFGQSTIPSSYADSHSVGGKHASSFNSNPSNTTSGRFNDPHHLDLHVGGSFNPAITSPRHALDLDSVLPSKIDRNDSRNNVKHGSAQGTNYSSSHKSDQPIISPPSSGLPPSSLGSGTTPGRSWLDFPTPGTRSLLSPSHLMTTSIGTFPSSNGTLPNAWPGSAITSPHSKRKGPTDYFAGAVPLSSGDTKSDMHTSSPRLAQINNNSSLSTDKSRQEQESAYKKRRLEHEKEEFQRRSDTNSTTMSSTSSNSRSHSSERFHRMQVEAAEEERMDQLDEDEVTGGHDVDVLSTPLRLLAHASDAALALRQAKGEAENTSSRPTKQGAATMGLVSPPVPTLPAPSRWFNSGRLPNVGLSGIQSAGLRSGLLPKLRNVAQRRELERLTNPKAKDAFITPLSRISQGLPSFAPPNLGALGRSRSYTAVEAVNLAQSSFARTSVEEVTGAPIVTPVTQSERRAEVLGIHTDIDGRQIEIAKVTGGSLKEKSVTATTLDPDAWEYRNGRARSRKQTSAEPTNTNSGTETNGTEDDKHSSHQDLDGEAGVGDAMEEDVSASNGDDDESMNKTGTFRSRLGSIDVQRRWEVVRRRPSRPSIDIAGLKASEEDLNTTIDSKMEDAVSIGSSEESEKLGASHQDFFSMGIFHSKMDNDLDLDPLENGLISLRELERLFDIFFARINPLLTLFDPFLHSVTYVRNRSALLTTVIAALAARLSDQGRDAKLAVMLENYWRQKLLPEALLGGYKSVELAQAFLVLAIYHKPTNRLSEDRSWQYLGFAIRIATEIGVNRLAMPNDEVKDNEQVRRRIRNRHRLWISLWLTDRNLSLQTGRPATIMEDDVVANSDLWHREDFALPEDARLVSLVKLIRITTKYIGAFAEIVTQTNAALQNHLPATSTPVISQAQESVKSLNFCRLQAITELERWKDIWCVEALDESTDGIQSLAIATFLVKWRPRAVIDLRYFRLHLNSIILEAMERHQRFVLAALSERAQTAEEIVNEKGNEARNLTDANKSAIESLTSQKDDLGQMIDKVALDCWETSLRMIDIVLSEVQSDDLSAGPNALAVNVIYGALAALRLSNAGQHVTRSRENREAILRRCKSLSEALIKAGRTPEHRNGAAAPFGIYLKGIVTLWETENVGISGDENNKDLLEESGDDHKTLTGGLDMESSGEVSTTKSQTQNNQDSGSNSLANKSPSRNHQRSNTDPDGSIRANITEDRSLSDENLSTPPRLRGNIGGTNKPVSLNSKNQPGSAMNTPSNQGNLPPQHTVGDEIWGAASSTHGRNQQHRAISSNVQIAPDAESMDRMWDYLTTYPDASSTFPMSLWQPPLLQSTYISTSSIPIGPVLSTITVPNTAQVSLDGSSLTDLGVATSVDPATLADPNNVAAAAVVASNVNLNLAALAPSSAA